MPKHHQNVGVSPLVEGRQYTPTLFILFTVKSADITGASTPSLREIYLRQRIITVPSKECRFFLVLPIKLASTAY